jgi:uncharacterized membrane protein HdeD (DUF308 family)
MKIKKEVRKDVRFIERYFILRLIAGIIFILIGLIGLVTPFTPDVSLLIIGLILIFGVSSVVSALVFFSSRFKKKISQIAKSFGFK